MCQPTNPVLSGSSGGLRAAGRGARIHEPRGLYRRDFWKTKRILPTRLRFVPRRAQGTRFSPCRRGGRRRVQAAMGTPRVSEQRALGLTEVLQRWRCPSVPGCETPDLPWVGVAALPLVPRLPTGAPQMPRVTGKFVGGVESLDAAKRSPYPSGSPVPKLRFRLSCS